MQFRERNSFSDKEVRDRGNSTRNLLVGVLAEDVLNDHNGFLHHIIDLGLNEVKQCADTTLC